MELSHLHFAHPLWLWGGLVIPLVWILFFLFYRTQRSLHQLEKFIDRHLLPYLLVNNSNKKNSFWKTLLAWSIVWGFLTLALAGPRWSFREMETFSRDQSLVILLDLSESMNATDIKPSRLARAKQKIEDLLHLSKGVKIGLIAFAADSHMITPITDDKETIRHLLPSLETDLVYIQGSRLSPALNMASTMLEAEPGHNKALLIMSDGGFEDASAITTAKKLADKGIVIYTMGVGTPEGAPLRDHKGSIIKKNGAPLLSKIEKEKLNEISHAGNGRYLDIHYANQDEALILSELEKRADTEMQMGKKSQLWDEHFYLLIFPALPFILWWFKRGYVFVILFFLPIFGIEATVTQDYFKNSEELGKESLEAGDYESAINAFQDSYRKGVAYYKAGKFPEAEEMFRQSSRPEVAAQAAYNLGNALVQQQKLKEAVTAYEDVLKTWPDHTKAKENLELVKALLEQQQQENSNSENSDQQQDQKQNQNESEKKNQNDKKDSEDSKDQQQPQDNQQQQDKQDTKDKKQPQSDQQEQNKQNAEEQQKQQQDMKEKQAAQQEKEQAGADQQEEQKEKSAAQKERQEAKADKSQEDQDADLWLNQITNDPKTFLKNKFYIESKKNGTTEGIDPW